MQASDWISLAALVLATLALILGEARGRNARRTRSERNIVDWAVSWPTRDAFVVESRGPDVAKNVLVQLTAESVTVEAIRRRMRRGEQLRVAVPHLASLWDATQLRLAGDGAYGERVNIIHYGGRIAWSTPAGVPREFPLDSSIQVQLKAFVGITNPADSGRRVRRSYDPKQ